MTQYFTDFSDSTPDSAPSGWTAQWYNTGDWLYRAGGYVEINQTDWGNSLLLWTDLGILTDCEILIKLRLIDNTAGDQFLFGAVARTNATRAYRGGVKQDAFFIVAGGINQNTGADSVFGIGTPTNGALSSVPTGTDYWVRLQVIGTAFKFKAWEDGTAEPLWAIEANAPINYADGYVGVYSHHRDATKHIYLVGVTDSPSTESAPSEPVSNSAEPPAGSLGLTALIPVTNSPGVMPTGTLGLTALLPGLSADQPMPAGSLGLTGLLPTPAVGQPMPVGSLGLTGLLPSVPVLQGMPVGSLGLTALAIPTPTVQVTGSAVRIYRLKLTIGGEATYAVPVNWQARYAIDRQNQLSVTLHNPPQSLLDTLLDALGTSPPETVLLTIQGGYRWPSGSSYYQDMVTSLLQTVTSNQGSSSYSVQLSGYMDATLRPPKAVTLPSAENIRSGNIASTWRGGVLIDLAPGDLATLPDTGAQWAVGNISYRVDARSATMEVSELTDADILATLPW